MKSNYYLGQIDSESFQRKLFINLFKDSIIKAYKSLQSDEFKDKLGSESEIVEMENLLNSQIEDGQSISSIIDHIKKYSVDQLDDIMIEAYQQFKENLQENGKHKIGKFGLMLSIFSQNMIPEKVKAIHF